MERGHGFVKDTSFALVPWQERSVIRADVIVQCTSVGMAPDLEDTPVDRDQLAGARAVIEIIASPGETRLVREARALNKAVSSGPEFSLDQACEQFRLYTGKAAPREAMQAAIDAL